MRPKSKPHPFRFTIFRPNRSKPLGLKPLPPDAASFRTSNLALLNQKNRLGGDENPGNVVSIAIFRHSTTLFLKFLGKKRYRQVRTACADPMVGFLFQETESKATKNPPEEAGKTH